MDEVDRLIARITRVMHSLSPPKEARNRTIRLLGDGGLMALGLLGPITGGVTFAIAAAGLIDFLNLLRRDSDINNLDSSARNELQLLIQEIKRLEVANREGP
ncbi:MAG: hypothetical protein EXR08_03815 [Alphaproteobacteria bacterium]|nr:hypothetical protein [Alphaproteobacteria bacterium]